MNNLTIQSLSLALSVFVLTACGPKPEPRPDLTILHTGRIRGNVYPQNLEAGMAPLQYYPLIAGYVASVREEAKKNGSEVVLVDLGDSLTGSFASLATNSENVVRFFNEVAYDAVVLGNLDADLDPRVIEKLQMPVLTPFISPADGSPAPPVAKLAAAFPKSDIVVQLLPNFYGDLSQTEAPARFPATFCGVEAPVVPLRDYSPVVATLGSKTPDTLRLFSWMKFESPKAAPLAYLEMLKSIGVDAVLAQRIYSSSQKDVWAADDSFLKWSPPVSQNILRENRGFTVARLDLKKRPGGGWDVLKYELVPMVANSAPADQSVAQSLAELAPAIQDADEEVIELQEAFDRETILLNHMQALGNLVAGAHGVLYSPESIRAEWAKGPLRSSRVYEAVPWSTEVWVVNLSPAELKPIVDSGKYSLLLREQIVAEDESLEIVTSGYFAHLLKKELGLRDDAVRVLAPGPEYLYLAQYVQTMTGGFKTAPPRGWKYEPAR